MHVEARGVLEYLRILSLTSRIHVLDILLSLSYTIYLIPILSYPTYILCMYTVVLPLLPLTHLGRVDILARYYLRYL